LHCKKKIYSTEPLKKVPEISKSVQRGLKSQKTNKKKSTKSLKVLPVYPGEEPSPKELKERFRRRRFFPCIHRNNL